MMNPEYHSYAPCQVSNHPDAQGNRILIQTLLKYVILRSEATKNLVRPMQNRDSSLPSVAQNDKLGQDRV